jgi:hypothetical protein
MVLSISFANPISTKEALPTLSGSKSGSNATAAIEAFLSEKTDNSSEVLLAGPAPKLSRIGVISKAIVRYKSVPTGYKGANKKVSVDRRGNISFTAQATGSDVGVFIEVPPVNVGTNKYLTLDLTGKVFQRQGWAHWGSIQVLDKSGKRYTLRELCQSNDQGKCSVRNKDPRINPLKAGKRSLKLKLPRGLKDIKRIEFVFPGKTMIFKGFTFGNIGLSR